MIWLHLKYIRWHHLVWCYAIAAIVLAWHFSGATAELERHDRASAAKQQLVTGKVRAKLPEYEVEVRAIKERIETDGFENFAQTESDRERLIIIQDLLSMAASENGYSVSEESEFYALHGQLAPLLRVLIDQMHDTRIKDEKYLHSDEFKKMSEEDSRAWLNARWEKWQGADGQSNGLLGPSYQPIELPYSLHVPFVKSVILLFLALFYLAMIPFGLLSQIRKIAQCDYSVWEQLTVQPAMTVFFSIAWPLMGWHNPAKLVIRTRTAWLKRIEPIIGVEKFREIEKYLWSNVGCTLEEVSMKFEDVGWSLHRYRSSRLQRVAVFCSVLMVMFKFNVNVADAQEPPTPIEQQHGEQFEDETKTQAENEADPLTLHYVEGESAIETGAAIGPLNKPIRLSWNNTFAKAVGRANFVSHGEDTSSSGLTTIQLRPKVTYGPWSAYAILSLIGEFKVLEAYLNWNEKIAGWAVNLRFGRMFIPCLAAIPPPFGGMLDGAMTDAAFDFFGEGLSVSLSPLDGLTLTAMVTKPVNETSIPANWVFSASYCLCPEVALGAMAQFGSDPDEDWLLGGEVTGKLGGDLYYEVLAVVRERPGEQLMYGTHAFVSYQLTEEWVISGQFDWLNTEEKQGSDRIAQHFRATLAIWFEPIDFVRLQVEVAGDWKRRAQHENAVEILGGAIVRF